MIIAIPAMFLLPITYQVVARPYFLRRQMQDHVFAAELRDDCRQLMAITPVDPQSPFAKIEPASYPSSIRALGPSYVLVSPDKVLVELAGGHDHFGVECYPAGVPGDGELVIDGLYLYRR
jgi:hypothetical protein